MIPLDAAAVSMDTFTCTRLEYGPDGPYSLTPCGHPAVLLTIEQHGCGKLARGADIPAGHNREDWTRRQGLLPGETGLCWTEFHICDPGDVAAFRAAEATRAAHAE